MLCVVLCKVYQVGNISCLNIGYCANNLFRIPNFINPDECVCICVVTTSTCVVCNSACVHVHCRYPYVKPSK